MLLEPIGTLKAYVPSDNTGDLMGDINKRRGRVLGMEPTEDDLTCIEAEVPMAEMGDFSTVPVSYTHLYTSYLEGKMSDYIPTDEELQKSFDTLPKIG